MYYLYKSLILKKIIWLQATISWLTALSIITRPRFNQTRRWDFLCIGWRKTTSFASFEPGTTRL